MSVHLLIEGPSGIGKTTLLLKKLGPLREMAGGFITQRMIDGEGGTRGFCLTAARAAESAAVPFIENQPDVFIDRASGTYLSGLFLSKGIELIRNPADCPFRITDEIGGVELLEPTFFSALVELFSKNTPCIGVLKSHPNSAHLVSVIGSDTYGRKYAAFRENLLANPKVKIVSMNRRDEPEAVLEIDKFINTVFPLKRR